MKKGLNNEGFTLVELLAIMVILGVLLMVAIPQVTRTITDSRKEVFVDTAVAFLSSAKTGMVNGSYTQSIPIESTYSVCIPFTEIDYEKGSKSPFGSAIDTKSSYVKVYNDKGSIRYYVYMRDQKDHFLGPVEESVINATAKKTKLVFNKSHFYKGTASPFTHETKKGSYRDPANIIYALGKPVTKESDPAGLCTYLVDPDEKLLSELTDGYEVYDPVDVKLLDHTNDADYNTLRNMYSNYLIYYGSGSFGYQTPTTSGDYSSALGSCDSCIGYPNIAMVEISREPRLKEYSDGHVGYDKTDDGDIIYDTVSVTPFEAYLAHQLPGKLREGASFEDDDDDDDW